MTLQNRLEIKGENDTYLIAPTDSASVLKPNGEICSTYLGFSEKSGRKVVIKRYHPWVNSSPAYFWRVEREAQACTACSGLSTELILSNGVYYLITDFIEGISFNDITRWRFHRKLRLSDLILLSIKALKALQRIHSAGFVHCDIKPSNVIVTTNNPNDIAKADVRIVDFGMTRIPAEPLHAGVTKLPFALIYSAPEQILNLWELIGYHTDLYAMGVTLWQLFTRIEPWRTGNPLKTVHVQLTQPLLKSNRVPDRLMGILHKCTVKPQLAKPPHYYTRTQLKEMMQIAIAGRYGSASEFLWDIERLAL